MNWRWYPNWSQIYTQISSTKSCWMTLGICTRYSEHSVSRRCQIVTEHLCTISILPNKSDNLSEFQPLSYLCHFVSCLGKIFSISPFRHIQHKFSRNFSLKIYFLGIPKCKKKIFRNSNFFNSDPSAAVNWIKPLSWSEKFVFISSVVLEIQVGSKRFTNK